MADPNIPNPDDLIEVLPEGSLPPDDEDDLVALEEQPDDVALVEVEPPPPPLGRSWAFDFVRGGFVTTPRPGIGRAPLPTHGESTLRHWIEKCLRTARDAHAVHPPDYGLERPWDVIGLSSRQAMSSDLTRRIEDALTVHPRITEVRDFDFNEDAEDAEVLGLSFRVVLDDATSLQVEAFPLGG